MVLITGGALTKNLVNEPFELSEYVDKIKESGILTPDEVKTVNRRSQLIGWQTSC